MEIESTNLGSFEGKLGDFVCAWLERNGIQARKDEFAPGRFNVVAVLPGEIQSPNLVYICHMDTVPVCPGWTHDPFKPVIEGNRMYGLGACDMKSGLAMAMLVFRDAVRSGKKPRHTFTFIASADEENVMEGVEQALRSGYITKDSWVVDLEPTHSFLAPSTEYDGAITIAHKGKTWFEINTHGVSAHASIPEKGVDAVAAMAAVIQEIRKRLAALPEDKEMGFSTAVFGTMQGGSNINVVPAEATLTVDMRLAPPLTTEGSIALVEEAIAAGTAQVPGSKGDYKITAKRPYVGVDYSAPLLAKLQAANKKVTGKGAKVFLFPGYTDSGVVAANTGNINAMSFGARGENFHKPDEYVDCDSVLKALAVVTQLTKDILFE